MHPGRILSLALRCALLLATIAGFREASCELPAELDLAVRTAESAGWTISGLNTRWQLKPDGDLALTLTADSIDVPQAGDSIRNLMLRCEKFEVYAGGLACRSAQASLEHPVLRPEVFRVRFRLRAEGVSTISFDGMPAFDGNVSGSLEIEGDRWQVDLSVADLGLTGVGERVPYEGLKMDGTLNARLTADGDRAGPARLAFAGSIRDLAFTNPESTAAGEELGVRFDLKAQRDKASWMSVGSVALERGVLYLDPVLIEVPDSGLRLSAGGSWLPEPGKLVVDTLEYSHPGVVGFGLSATLSTSDGLDPGFLDLRLDEASFPGLYETYLQPLLIGSALDSLQTRGSLSGKVVYGDGSLRRISLRPEKLSASDTLGRFGLGGVSGQVEWRDGTRSVRSRLRFDSGEIYRVGFGPGEIVLDSNGRSVRLAGPASIPVLDGALLVESFELDDVTDPLSGWRFDGALTPVSMERFTDAIGWPQMSGKLSGMVPDVRYAEGTLTLGGALLMRVFDGTVSVANLVLRNPFGVAPHLEADARLTNLDLDALTRRFSFGRMTGRLDGHVLGLEMSSWAATSFDAWIGTPPGDRSRHRISQEAVDSIASIGGGATGVLSHGFLSLFKSFAYDRVGLNCRLRGGVCTMGGVAPARDGGYYIVKGKWLPRIDVIGHSHEVDWQVLVDRLLNLDLEVRPVIE